jgi:hypothetical protein
MGVFRSCLAIEIKTREIGLANHTSGEILAASPTSDLKRRSRKATYGDDIDSDKTMLSPKQVLGLKTPKSDKNPIAAFFALGFLIGSIASGPSLGDALHPAGLEPATLRSNVTNVRPYQPTGRPQFKTFRPLPDRRDLNR